MAPEILEGQPCQGQVVDLFALGVILFILYAGHQPFKLANNDDSYYKQLACPRPVNFWNAHENLRFGNSYSDEFKNLITWMLQYAPYQRLGSADIIGHPWLARGYVARTDQVRNEICLRNLQIKENLIDE